MTKLRYTMFAVTALLVLALSAMSTVPALADDSTPPPAETPIVETPPTEEVTEEAPAAEEIPVAEIPVVEESVPEETAPVEETVAELLTQVPEGTDVVVVNEEGETVPLVTQEAAEIIATSDPQWCPVGVAPNSATCSGFKDSFNGGNANTDLIAWLLANQAITNKAGVIWIEAGYVGSVDVEGVPIILNGDNFTNMDNFALTINGGWTGTGTTLNPNTPSTFNVSLSIINWNGAITLNNLLFTGVTTGSASNNAALNVQTTKNVILNNVNTSNNTGANVKGVYIDNDEGTVVSAVNVNTSNLNGNNATGLTVFSDGIITLKDVTASNNNGVTADGIYLDNRAGIAVISFTGATIAADNGDDGIEAYSDGAITASNLVANSNGGFGTTLNNLSAATALGVTISGSSNQFKFNGTAGLEIRSNGAITLNSISATNNLDAGAVLYNDSFPSGLANVTLTGTNNIKENNNHGLLIYSDGVVTLSNISANDNGNGDSNGFGLLVDNNGASTPKAVTLTGINQFNGNYSGGIYVESDGAITISNLTASNNVNGRGAELDNVGAPSPQNVTITGTTNVNGNDGTGLLVNTLGVISIGNITANDNSGSGVSLDNSSGTVAKTVTLSGASNNFNGNTTNGLYILSLGAVTLKNVTASNNTNGHGLLVANNFGNPLVPQNVTLNGYGQFVDNGTRGIEVQTYGVVLLNNIYADSNTTGGIFVDNYSGGSLVKTVTINGYADAYNSTGGYGLYILSRGAIKINALDASGNANGAFLDNNNAGSVGGVTLTGSNDFLSNTGNGLMVESRGAILINDLDAAGNVAGFGANLDNTSAATPLGVTLSNTSTNASIFSDNGMTGLVVFTKGAVTITNLVANENLGSGAVIDNTYSGTASPQNVTLSGIGQFNSNGDDGLFVVTYGTLTTNNLTANDNGQNNGSFGYGVVLDNCDHNGTTCNAVTPKSVTLNGTNIFNNNHLGGLFIKSRGAIKANNLTASLNGQGTGQDGAYLDNANSFGLTSFSITLTGTNIFEDNGKNGLTVFSHGAVTVSNLSASLNFAHGAYIDSNNKLGPVAKVTLTGNNFFNGNGDGTTGGGQNGTGLVIFSDSVITISNLTANNNTENGAVINAISSGNDNSLPLGTYWTPLPAAVIKLTGMNTFSNNGLDGLSFFAPGSVDISKITADNNGGDGVEGISEKGNITITCGSMTNNTGYGWRLNLLTSGKLLTLKGVFTTGNTTGPFVKLGGTLVSTRTC